MKNPIQLSAEEVESLIADVEREIAQSLGKSEPRLAKADDGKDDQDDAASAVPAGPDAGAPPGASAPGAPPAPAGPDASASPDASAPPGAPDASASPEGSPPADMGALKAAYAELPPDQLEMHYLAVKAALAEKMGSQSPSMGAGDQSAPPAESPSPAGPPVAMKNEIAPSPGSGGKAVEKSEKSDAEMADLRKTVDVLTKAVEMLATPQRKAVTSVSFLSKGEDQKPAVQTSMTKGEIKTRLADKIRTSFGALSKSDKDAIKAYELGEVTADKIAHLLA